MIESHARQAKVILHVETATTDVSPGRGSQLAMCGSIYIFWAIYHANRPVDLSARVVINARLGQRVSCGWR